jgi:hypothetical protein
MFILLDEKEKIRKNNILKKISILSKTNKKTLFTY